MDVGAIAQAAAGLLLLAFLPGYAWTSVLLPGLRSRVERLVFSVGLSVVLVTLALYFGNVLLGVPIAAVPAAGWAAAIAAAGFAPRVAEAVRRRVPALQ